MSLEFQDSYQDFLKAQPKPLKPPPKPTTKVMTKKIVAPPKKKKKPWEWSSTDTHGYKTRKAWRQSMAALGKPTSGGFSHGS